MRLSTLAPCCGSRRVFLMDIYFCIHNGGGDGEEEEEGEEWETEEVDDEAEVGGLNT